MALLPDDDAAMAVAYRSRVGANSLAAEPRPLTWPRLPAPWPRVGLAIAVAVFQVAASFGAAEGQPDRDPIDGMAIALLLVGPIAIAAKRRFPVAAAAVTIAATNLYIGLGYPYGPIFVSLVITLETAVMVGRRRDVWIVAAAGFVAYLGLGVVFEGAGPPTALHAAAVAAWLIVVLVVAEVVRATRERAAEAAHARAEEGRRRASEERLRMARELHDVLAHNISLINVRAGVALHLIDEKPDEVRASLTAIKDASKETLREMRSILGVLRQVDEADDAPRTPAPSLARLGDLVSRAKAAGLKVDVEVDGPGRPLPAGIDLAAYRIVQEALTNVTRHSQASNATVRLTYGDGEVTVQIDDDGPAAPSPATVGSGSGVAGMRERVMAIGGDLAAGRRPDGGFRVKVRLPLEDGE